MISRTLFSSVVIVVLGVLLAVTISKRPANIHQRVFEKPDHKLLEKQQKLAGWRKLSKAEFRSEVCSNMDGNGLVGIKCAPEDHQEFYKLGKQYVLENGQPGSLGPIVFLPGFGGAGLEASISKEEAPHWWCFNWWPGWFRVWLPLEQVLLQSCWMDNLRVDYNISTDTYSNVPGVDISVMDWGGTGGMDYLDYWFGLPVPFTTYYNTFFKSLQYLGYETGKNLFGAPYDWRIPSTQRTLNDTHFFEHFEDLVEKAFDLNGGAKIHIVAHSMGAPTAMAFLNTKSQQWIDKYISSFISISAPWSGTGLALRTVLSGDDLGISLAGISLLNWQEVAEYARTSGGIIEHILNPHFWDASKVMVEVHDEERGRWNKYTPASLSQLFRDINSTITAVIHSRVDRALDAFVAPRVPTHCLYGVGIPTEIAYNYTRGIKYQPIIYYDSDGDGTIPAESLQMCSTWNSQQKAPVMTREFELTGHQSILEDYELFEHILRVVTHDDDAEYRPTTKAPSTATTKAVEIEK